MNAAEDQFEIHMTLPSLVELLDKLEAWQNVVDVAERMSTLGDTMGLDKRDWTIYILENVMWLSKEDVKKFARGIPKNMPADQMMNQNSLQPPQPFSTPFTNPGAPPPDTVNPGDNSPEEPEKHPAQGKESDGSNGVSAYASAEVDRLILEINKHMASRVPLAS
jgi:hypothetical protein